MAIEEVRSLYSNISFLCLHIFQEFSIEIPDAEADEIQTVGQGTYCLVPPSGSPAKSLPI